MATPQRSFTEPTIRASCGNHVADAVSRLSFFNGSFYQ